MKMLHIWTKEVNKRKVKKHKKNKKNGPCLRSKVDQIIQQRLRVDKYTSS